MTFTPEQVERIVLEVIRRLGLLSAGSAGVAVGEQTGVAASKHSSTTAELTLSDKVITIRSIEGRLAGIERLVVAAKAVVTP
ncbi:MAG: hypothetical protein MUF06_07970, partial [Pirellulaceae bacterium]|nr:hypothetical protein [Pirellulaceae bacterium]